MNDDMKNKMNNMGNMEEDDEFALADTQVGEELSKGGRRRKKGGKGTKKRKENPVLASWRKFVRKVQHEEKITYPEAMKRASKRKSEWQRGGSVEAHDQHGSAHAAADHSDSMKMPGPAPKPMIAGSRRMRGGNHMAPAPMIAGKSRRRRMRGGNHMVPAIAGGSKKRRMSRRR